LRLEVMVDRPDDPLRLNGCGLLVVNPPWPLEGEAQTILPALAERLARARMRASGASLSGRASGRRRDCVTTAKV
jgi:23S rRNA (adenine2030-N6)-methyltransferase